MVKINVGKSPNLVPAVAQSVLSIASSIPTSDPSYFLPLRPKVTIRSNDGTITYFIYDPFIVDVGSFSNSMSVMSFTFGNESYTYRPASFSTTSMSTNSFTQVDISGINQPTFVDPSGTLDVNPNRIRIISVEVDLAQNQSGSFRVQVEDSQRVVDTKQVGPGCRFEISVGKTPTSFNDIMVGYCKVVNVKRDDTGLLIYTFSGYGSQIVFNERIVDFNKQAARQQLGSIVASTIDQNTTAYNLVKSLVEGFSGLPIKGLPSIIQQAGFTEAGLDPRVNTFIPAISQPLVQAAQCMDTICNMSGSIWGVQNNDLFLRYPSQVHTGVTIKDTVEDNDPVNKTSYFIGPFEFTDSIDLQDGFCNGLYLKGGTLDPTADVQATSSGGSTSLYQKDIAQQFIPGSARLKNVALLLSKLGSGGSLNQQFVTGAIVHDNNGRPTGSKVLDLQIPVSSIGATPTAVFDFNAKFSVKDIQVNSPMWIILYAKGTSEDNTIRWFHDGGKNTENAFSATRVAHIDPGSEDRTSPPLKSDSSGWNVSTTGPIYTHSFFKGVRALAYAADPQSIAKYGRVEAVHNVQWISDQQTLQTYASNILAALAKPIRKFTFQQVTIPNDFVFLPGQLISIIDNLSGIVPPEAISCEIQEVRYTFQAPSGGTAQNNSAPGNNPGAGGGSHGLGSNYCEVMAVSYIDFLTAGI